MKIPGFPPDEEQRLQSLKAACLLGAGHDERFDRLTRLAKHIFDAPLAMITLVGEDSLRLKSHDGMALGHYSARSTSFCAHALPESEPTVVNDTLRDARFADNPNVVDHPHIRFYAGCPVRLPDGAVAGTLCLMDTRVREFSHREILMLKDLASLVEDEFSVLDAATVDELTGLYNRRGISALAQYSLVASQRRAEPLSLAFIDMDTLKGINDGWGREQGDRALKAIAGLLQSSFRDTDLISRHGGDEFVVIFPDTPERGAFIALEYLREQVEEFNRTSGEPWKLAFSVGIAEYDGLENAAHEDLIKLAGKQLYKM